MKLIIARVVGDHFGFLVQKEAGKVSDALDLFIFQSTIPSALSFKFSECQRNQIEKTSIRLRKRKANTLKFEGAA